MKLAGVRSCAARARAAATIGSETSMAGAAPCRSKEPGDGEGRAAGAGADVENGSRRTLRHGIDEQDFERF
jgi:hypothetical protein